MKVLLRESKEAEKSALISKKIMMIQTRNQALTSKFQLGSISIKKIDKNTGDPVDGASYYMYEDADCEEFLCELKGTGGGYYASGGGDTDTE